jgi:hypothetical protein
MGVLRGVSLISFGGILRNGSRTGLMGLTDTEIKKSRPAEAPYRLKDAGGMYLIVSPAGGKLWRWKYRFEGKES